MLSRLRSFLALLLLVGASACGSGHADVDSGTAVDAGMRDAQPSDAGRVDAQAVCAPACAATELCCADSHGDGRCINPREDVENCGGCGKTCLGGKGTACVLGSCVCGRVDFGCLGTDESLCCPARTTDGLPYCANLRTDGDDCGACGAACDIDQANMCAETLCVCGAARGPCTGAPDSRCCSDGLGAAFCVDTTSDTDHCGSCGNRCGFGETCMDGLCTLGVACPSGCSGTGICCHGVCCVRAACARDACGFGADAGVTDAGVTDAGVTDAGVTDTGVTDTGVVANDGMWLWLGRCA